MEQNEKINYFNFTGCSQKGRYSKELEPAYIQIDEQTFIDKLVYAFGLSKLINHYGSDNQPDGDWSDFLRDEAVILAAISFIKPAEFESEFKRYIHQSLIFKKSDKKLKYLKASFVEIFRVAKKIDTWYQNLRDVEHFQQQEVRFRSEIANIIDTKLAVGLARFKELCRAAADEQTLQMSFDFEFQGFGVSWEVPKGTVSQVTLQGQSIPEWISTAADALQKIFQVFYEAVIYLKQKALKELNLSMAADNHYPEVALLLAFLKLFEAPQQKLNQLTFKYLDYYYRDILKQSERNALNDKVFLSFELDKKAQETLIPKGTKFIAGIQNLNKDVFYCCDDDIVVNKAKLSKMVNLFIASRQLKMGGEQIQRINNIYKSEIPVINWSEKPDLSKRMAYPTFGEDQQGKGENDVNMSYAPVGLAVSSPVLLMAEGKRELCINIQLTSQAYHILEKKIKEIALELDCSYKEAVAKCFINSLLISVTSAKGWLLIKNNIITVDPEHNSIVIKFDIKASDPEIVPVSKSLHQEEINSEFPLMKLQLNNASYFYPYSLLNEAEIEQIVIHAKVSGVKKLLLHNNMGAVNPTSPFYPFGPVPKVGSFLVVGNNEIFQKQLDNLKVHLEWFDLPQEQHGFKDYYSDYKTKVDNTSFEVALSVLEEGKWSPENEEEQQVLKLFRTKDAQYNPEPTVKAPLSSKTSFANIDMDLIAQAPNYSEIKLKPDYNSMSKRGFLKLELVSPLHAFGHDIYPSLVSEITLENSKSGFLKGKSKKELPKPAFAPQVKSISLDYETTTKVAMKENFHASNDNTCGEALFHIYPYGFMKIFPNKDVKRIKIVPEFDTQGELYLGFTELRPPQVVSVLFEMLDEFNISSEEEPPVVEWSYLANNRWYMLKPSNILRDDTNNFLKSGIIMLDIPESINRDNTLFDNAYYWLKVSVKKNIEVASRNLSVTSQVTTATLQGDEAIYASGHLDKPLPRYSIQRPVKKIAGVKSVVQPLQSFGGLAHEKEKAFRARTSERLKHRKRAVTTWDFERLVLDHYMQIEKVVCLPNMTSNSLNAPGNVLLVVSPFASSVLNSKEPKASSELLYKIKSYVQHHCSPFTQIEVRNPSYERIRIICSVKFSGNQNKGFYIQKLNEDINDYLTGNIGNASLGQQMDKIIYCSDVMTYLRTLPYVEYITQFSMVQAARDITGNYILIDTADEKGDRAGLKATKPWSLLVPADQHQFTILSDKKDEDSKQAGIDYLELGNDFIINE